MSHTSPTRRHLLANAAGAALALSVPALRAQAKWPVKPIEVVVPFPPGGIVDNVTRALSTKLNTALGQQLIIQNKPGAGGSIGTGQVARATPDGHTLLMTFDTHVVNPQMYKLPFDSEKDLTPVVLVSTSPLILATPTDVPATSVKELVDLAKSKPGVLNYASTGAGSSNQLAAELFKMTAGVDIAHVPYKGGAPAIADVLAGRIQVMFVSAPSVLAHIKAGKMKALAVTTRERIPQLPDVPTVAETYPGFEVKSWVGMLAPGKTPPEVVERLNREVLAALKTPELQALFRNQALIPAGGTPQDFGRFMREQGELWGDVIRKANIKAD